MSNVQPIRPSSPTAIDKRLAKATKRFRLRTTSASDTAITGLSGGRRNRAGRRHDANHLPAVIAMERRVVEHGGHVPVPVAKLQRTIAHEPFAKHLAIERAGLSPAR